MTSRWRIIDTGALSPAANMAFDETLLKSYELRSSRPTLRIYGWEPQAISIGYSQDPERTLDISACDREHMPFVRRITGGGVIMHAREITYSLVCSKDDLGIPARVVSSYKAISAFLIEFYKKLGIEAKFACDAEPEKILGRRSTLCFAAKEKYDIVVNGKKIGGSAQKRSKDIIFQHGSIPLGLDMKKASSFLRDKQNSATGCKPTSLEEILGHGLDAASLSAGLIKAFSSSFCLKMDAGELSATEKRIFDDLKALKYGSMEWNYRRIENPDLKRDDIWKRARRGRSG